MLEKICIILAINLIFYFKTLKFKYVSDDIPVFHHPPKTKHRWHRLFLWLRGDMRWKPENDHVLTMGTHALISVLLYLAFGATNISFVAAILFSINPVNNQGSMWISGRGYTLPTLFILSAMCIPVLAPVFLFLCSFFTIGYLAPIVVIGTSKWWLILIMPIIWAFFAKKFKTAVKNKIAMETVIEDKVFKPRKLILAIKTAGFYLALCVFPFKITFYHSFLQSCAGNDIMKKRAYSLCKFFWIGIGAMIGSLVYWYLFGWDLVTCGMFWYFIGIAPFSNIRRVQQEISERYAYFPNVGVMIALAALIVNYPVLITLFATMYGTKLFAIMRMYQDDYWLVEMATAEDIDAWYAWHIRGHKRWSVKSYREALIMWVMAKIISPKEFKLLFNIAVVMKVIGNEPESKKYIQLARDNVIPGQEEGVEVFFKDYAAGKHPLLI